MAIDFQKEFNKIVDLAQKSGNGENMFLVTTFADFKRMRSTLEKLQKNIDENGEVLKDGRVNPCINEYNKTAQAAASIAEKLIRMINDMMKQVSNVVNAKEKEKVNIVEEVEEKSKYEDYSNEELKLECKHFKIDFKGLKRPEVIALLNEKINTRYKWL